MNKRVAIYLAIGFLVMTGVCIYQDTVIHKQSEEIKKWIQIPFRKVNKSLTRV